MTIAITGATGQLGRLVIESLKTKTDASNIVALARRASKAAELGVAVREADYENIATLEAAFEGVETVLLISGNEIGKRVSQHKNVIDAAKKAGVKRIVYTSVLRADTSELSLAGEHRETEKALKESGIQWTILRNGWYTENYTMSVGGAVAAGAFIGSAGDGKISSAARKDYAEAAAAVLTSEGHEGKTYELAGDASYTLAELAAEISKQTGKTIPYNNLPESEYAKILLGVGLPEPLANGLANWDVSVSHGAVFDEGHELSKLIGRPTTPMAASVAEALGN